MRSWRSRAIVSRSAATAAATCWACSCLAWRRSMTRASRQIQRIPAAASSSGSSVMALAASVSTGIARNPSSVRMTITQVVSERMR